jgi:hypothetical protein
MNKIKTPAHQRVWPHVRGNTQTHISEAVLCTHPVGLTHKIATQGSVPTKCTLIKFVYARTISRAVDQLFGKNKKSGDFFKKNRPVRELRNMVVSQTTCGPSVQVVRETHYTHL